MKTFEIDITPDSHMISSIVNTNMPTTEGISELVDNSLDAGAKIIEIKLSTESIIISDDGGGCSDIQSMLALGRHRSQKGTKLGRYGVGLKNAACGMGKSLSVKTTQDGITREANIFWDDIRDRGWKGIVGKEFETNKKNGTEIEIGNTRRPSQKCVESALSFSFAPAIWDDIKIFVNGKQLEAWEPPLKREEICVEETHDSIDISFKVTAGLTDLNERDPFILAYEHRIIGGTTMPCKEYNASSKFIAFVELKGKWELLKHKDGIKDGSEAEWLWDRLNIICSELLKKVHKMGESVELSQMAAELEQSMNLVIGNAKRPNKNGEKGIVEIMESGRKIREAKLVEGFGSVKEREISRSSRRGFGITFEKLANGILGKVDINKSRVCVQFNEDHSFIKKCRDEKNMLTLKACAIFLLCNHQSTASEKTQLVFKFDQINDAPRFIELASSIFESIGSGSEIQSQEAA